MAYTETNIKNVVQEKLMRLSGEVTKKFDKDPKEHLSEKDVNEKVAAAVAAAFTEFVKDAVISIPAQSVAAGAMVAGPISVTGAGVLAKHTGRIT